MKNVVATSVALVLVTVAASAQDKSTADKSNAEIAHELANPNNSLGALNLPIDYISYKGDLPGAGSQDSWRATFQPVLPYPLAKGVNLFFRPAFPFLKDQPVPQFDDGFAGFDGSDWELGDISFDLAIGRTFPSKFVMVGGLAGSLDTASDDDVELGQTLLGPELAVAQLFD